MDKILKKVWYFCTKINHEKIRKFPYVTVGKLLIELQQEGLKISRPTFYRIGKIINLPKGQRSRGNWRTYTQEEADRVKKMLKEYFRVR